MHDGDTIDPILRPSALQAPQRLSEPRNWIEHIPFAFWLIDVHRPATVVELGTHTGNSYFAFAQAVHDRKLSCRCFAIDTWRGDSQTGFYGDDVFREVAEYNDRNFGSFSQLVRSTFADARKRFADGSIDLLHIDGMHDYGSARGDFDAWRPKLSQCGVVLFHDTNEFGDGFEVARLWAELTETYPHFSFLHGHGLGVLGVGDRITPELDWLFRLREPSIIEFVRRYFERLGAGLGSSETDRTSTAVIRRLVTDAAGKEAKLRHATLELEQVVHERDELATRVASQPAYRQLADQWAIMREALARATRHSLGARMLAGARHPISSAKRKAWRRGRHDRHMGRLLSEATARLSAKQETAGAQVDLTSWFGRYRIRGHVLAALSAEAEKLRGVKISVTMPVYATKIEWLRAAVDSVRRQIYPNWELVCVDDGSPRSLQAEYIEEVVSQDARVKLIRHGANRGTAAACNTALSAASGDHVMVLDHDDVLEPHALFRFAQAIAATGADLLYADEVLTSADNIDEVLHVTCRPAFSYDYYLCHPYFVHPVAVRRSIALAAGGYDENLLISHDVDFVLRVIERAVTVVHVPDVLYRWRTHASSLGHEKQSLVATTMRGVLARHLARVGHQAVVEDGAHFNLFRVRFHTRSLDSIRIGVIIPTKNKAGLVKRCMAALQQTVQNLDLRIVIVDHESDELESRHYLAELAGRGVAILPYSGQFNFSRMNNLAAGYLGSSVDFHLFVNNDVEAITPGWLDAMVDLGSRPDVGAVGATLLYPDDRIQHAGVAVGLLGAAEHCFKFLPFYQGGSPATYADYSVLAVRDYSAVTAACMLVRADVFSEVGGFDEALAVGFGDTDLCLRVRQRGYLVLNHGDAVLHHAESASRGISAFDPHPADSHFFVDRYRDLIDSGDPFFSPLLARDSTDGRLAAGAECPEIVVPRVVRIAGQRHHVTNLQPEAALPPRQPAAVGIGTGRSGVTSGAINHIAFQPGMLRMSGWMIPPAEQSREIEIRIGQVRLRADIVWQDSSPDIPRLPGRPSQRAIFNVGARLASAVDGNDVLVTAIPAGMSASDPPLLFGLNSRLTLPPQELIDIIGGGYAPIGFEFLRFMVGFAALAPTSSVLDMGCGCGRMAFALSHYLAEDAHYIGFDIVPKLVDWDREHITRIMPRFEFVHADIFNGAYNPSGRERSRDYRFPAADRSIDVCLAASLFTHLRADDARHYFDETSRVLKRGGRALFSFFVLDERSLASMRDRRAAFNFDSPADPPDVYTVSRDVPEWAIAVTSDAVVRWATSSGLEIEHFLPGFWAPDENCTSFQDIVILRKA
jgi:GT2 family glycosyltransferase/SAM-dependent methyltransferase